MIRRSCNAVRCKPVRKREKLAKGCLGQRSLQPLLYFVFWISIFHREIVFLFPFFPFPLSRFFSKPQVPPTSPIVLSLSLSLSLSLTFQFQFQFLFRAIRAKAKSDTLCGNFNFKEFRFFLSWRLFPKKWSLVDDLSLKKERKTEVKWNRHYHCWIRISF